MPEHLQDTAGLRMSEREVAKLITRAERGEPVGLDVIGPAGQGAHVIGVTGPPGAGKSTLVDALARELRARNQTVAVLAIDPSSHVTGGAVLGDRVRMSSHAQDLGIYIRSMATRGVTSGLARAAAEAVGVLEGAGYDIIVVETVGVGQVELDVLGIADTVALVLVPGLGDTMQMNKAGIMEIGDVFVVNMADRQETHSFLRELKQALMLGVKAHGDLPPIQPTVALTGEGVGELCATLLEIGRAQAASGERAARRRDQRSTRLAREVESRVVERLREVMASSPLLAHLQAEVGQGTITVRDATRRWVEQLSLTEG